MLPREELTLEEIDLSTLDFWARPPEVIEGAFATLRRDRPVAHFAERDMRVVSPHMPAPGAGYWALTRYADVADASRHPDVFRSGQGAVSVIDMPEEMVEYFSGMISTDNPRHARLRRIVGSAFSPRVVASVGVQVRDRARAVVDRICELGGGDFVTDVAAPLPLGVICAMMGIPEESYEDVYRCSNIILSEGDEEYVAAGADPIEAFLGAGAELTELMRTIGEERLSNPTDDLTTALVTTNVDGESLTHAELASFFVLLVVAGNETTRNAIAHTLWLLTEHPDERARWVGDLEHVTPTAVDEIVRWSSPVTWMRRTVASPVELGGQQMEAGDKVLLFYRSANRDDAVFEDPFRFDVQRSPNPHLGFGAAGPHFCLGAHLARREIAVMWREVLTRLPDIRSTAPPQRLLSSFVNGIKHLPCEWTPQPRLECAAGVQENRQLSRP
ncbi:MAG: cytochrome P450 [Acidimicrobiales bacterium]